MLSIFGNVLCTLKALPNIITNSGHHPLFFSYAISPILLLFFICKSPYFHIWKCTLDSGNSTQCCHQQWAPPPSSPICLTALPNIWKWSQQVHKNDKFFAGTRTPNTPTDQKNISLPHLFPKIYSEAMPAQKYISKVWQWHLRVHPPKIYPYCISLTKYILQLWHRHYNFCVTFQGPCVKNTF